MKEILKLIAFIEVLALVVCGIIHFVFFLTNQVFPIITYLVIPLVMLLVCLLAFMFMLILEWWFY